MKTPPTIKIVFAADIDLIDRELLLTSLATCADIETARERNLAGDVNTFLVIVKVISGVSTLVTIGNRMVSWIKHMRTNGKKPGVTLIVGDKTPLKLDDTTPDQLEFVLCDKASKP